MLESVLADILTRVLGQYLEGIDREHVRFGAWSGLVELRTVALRPEALAVLFETLGIALPVSVESGFIGLLRLVVPWKSLGSTPVQVHLHDVTLVAHPVRGDGSDDSQLELRERRIKRARLDTDDAVREASWDVSLQREQSTTTSWSSWLVSDQLRGTILDNIQVHMSNIILRFEDPYSNPNSPYVASMYCESIKIVSANSEWQEAFVEHNNTKVTRKILQIKGFRVDWAPIVRNNSAYTSRDQSSTSQRFESPEHLRRYVSFSNTTDSTQVSEDPSSPRSLIRRVDGTMRLRLGGTDPSAKEVHFESQDPGVDLDICFPDVFIELNDVQYSCLIQTSLYFARIATRGFRPSTPKARWKWAVDQLLPGCTDRFARACRFTPSGLEQTRERRNAYISLRISFLKARRTGVEILAGIRDELERLESATPFEELLAYRDAVDLAAEKYAQEWVKVKDAKEKPQETTSGTTRKSFWSMLGYSGTTEDNNNEDKSEVNEPPSESDSLDADVRTEKFQEPQLKLNQSKSSELRAFSTLALRAAFLLKKATLRMCEKGYPSIPTPRVELNLRDFKIGVMYSSSKDLVVESLLGSVEAWDLQHNSKMVYNRLSAVTGDTGEESQPDEAHALYPQNVRDAIESIRSGSNPAKDLLSKDDDHSGSDDKVRDSRESIFDDLNEPLQDSDSEEVHVDYKSRMPRTSSESSSRGSHRVTESEFQGNRLDPAADKYVAALRYTQPSSDVLDSSNCSAVLDVSVATLEAIVDGPKGSFLWGLKFWQPKGLVEDPIMAFLGAAAGARIAELRIELQQALLADSVPLEINAVILAPRFIIPSPSKTRPAIVVNMGTLGVCTSDSTPHVQGLAPSVEPKHLRYSNYVLTLDDLGMYFSPDLSTAVSKSPHEVGVEGDFGGRSSGGAEQGRSRMLGVERIIRPFSLHFVLQTLRDSSVAQVAHGGSSQDTGHDGVAKIRVRGNIPELSLILTQEAFQHILVSLRIWGDGLKSRESKRVPVTSVSTDADQPWKDVGDDGLTPVSTQKVLEGVSALANAISTPQDLQASKSMPAVSPNSVLAAYSVKLVLQTVAVELRENTNSRLVTAIASDLRASVVKKSKSGVEGNLSLRCWSVTDGSRGSTAAFRKLLYSGSVTDSESVSPPRSASRYEMSDSSQNNFVNVHYTLDFKTFEQKVFLRFLSVHMNCVRETFLRMVQFFDRVRRHVNQRRRNLRKRAEHMKTIEKEESSLENWSILAPATPGVSESPDTSKGGKIAVTSEFDGFTCQLVASGGIISSFEMKDSTIHFLRDPGGSQKAWGTFGSFLVRDLTAPVEEHINILSFDRSDLRATRDKCIGSSPSTSSGGPRSEWILEFPAKSEHTYRLFVTFDSIRILFLNRFTELIQDYFLALINRARPALASIIEETAAEFEDAERLMSAETYKSISTQFLCSLDLRDLSFRIPRHSSSISEALFFNIASVHIDNSKEKSLSHWWARFDGMHASVQYTLGVGGNNSSNPVTSTFMEDSVAELRVGPPSEAGTPGLDGRVSKTIGVRFPQPLCVNLSEAQYTVLFFVLTENIAETVPDDNITTTLEGFEQPVGESSNDLSQDVSLITGGISTSARSSTSVLATNSGGSVEGQTSTLKMTIEIPALSLEISRGWDVTQRSCKVIGLYLSNVCAEARVSTPRRLEFELQCKLCSISDLREEAGPDNRNLIVRLASNEIQCSEATATKEEDINEENVMISYDKRGADRPAIVVSLSQLQINVIPELLRDLSYLAVPGWPFLESSAFPPNYAIVGRTLTLVLRESQVTLWSESSNRDRRALVMTGEVEVKVDWMRNTGAKTISLSLKQMEVSSVIEVPTIVKLCEKDYGFKDLCVRPFEKSHAPLLYPTDSTLELIGPDVDDAGRRARLSVDAALCVLCTSEIPLLRAILGRMSSLQPSYLSRRKWSLPDLSPNESGDSSLKEMQMKKARESLNISVEIPVSRFLVTDDKESRFVPIVEARLTSLVLEAHASRMVQVTGQLSMDLFNPGKGRWEPAIEPWIVSASMSHGQSGSRAFVVRSDKRLNVNMTPNTITSAITVAKAVKEATYQCLKQEDDSVTPTPKVLEANAHAHSERPSVAAFLVRNELGISVHMAVHGERGWNLLAQNSEMEVGAQSESLVSSGADEKQRSRENVMKCSISIPGYGSHELSASEPGKFNFTFYPVNDPSFSRQNFADVGDAIPLDVIWEVLPRKGVPVCTLRSPFRIINTTMTKLDIVVTSGSDEQLKKALNSTEQSRTLSPYECYSIPIRDCYGTVHLRPAVSSSMASESSGKLNRPFLWSSPLPKLTWLMTMAQEKKLMEQHAGPNSRKKFDNFPLIECSPVHGDGHSFHFRAIPDTCESNLTSRSTWLDVSISAPVLLMNRLPGPLSYRIYKSTRSNISSRNKEEFGDSVLAAGVVQGMNDTHVHISNESLSSTSISVAFDNWIGNKSFNGTDLPSSFGPCENLQDLASGKVRAILPHQAAFSSPRGQSKKQFRVFVSPQRDGVCKFKFFAGIWVRNRSDTSVDVCGRSSFYSPGNTPVHLRECLPSSVPDEYICCEGPFLSVRLSQSDQTGSEEFLTHSDWWTTPSGVSDVSKPIPINLPGRSLELEIRPSVGIDAPTYVATIRNSSWISNNTSSDLEWCHQTSLDVQGNCPTRLLHLLQPGQFQGLHWSSKTSDNAVHIRLASMNGQSEWIWSPPIPLDIGFSRELPAKMYRPKTHDQYIARVASKEIAGNARVLVIYDEDRQNPPYRIVNLCRERALAFSQIGTKERPWLVRAGKNTRYSWDDPLARPDQRRLSVRVLEKEDLEGSSSKAKGVHNQRSQAMKAPPSTLNIDMVGERVMVLSEPFDPPVVFNVSVDGATKVLTLFDEGLDPNEIERLLSRKSNRKTSPADPVPIVALDDIGSQGEAASQLGVGARPAPDFPVGENHDGSVALNDPESEKSGVDAAVFLQSIGVSFIESTPEEFMYVTLSGLLLNFESFKKEQYLALSIEHFQIDNQLAKTSYPVLLWVSRNVGRPRGEGNTENQVINALAVELQRDVTDDDIFMLRNFRACVRPCHVSFEDGLVTSVLKFLDDAALVEKGKHTEHLHGIDEEGQTFRSIVSGTNGGGKHRKQGSGSSSKRIYAHDFRIDATSIRLTSEGSGSTIAKAAGLGSSARAIVGLLLNVENCDFVFADVSVQNVFDSLHHFGILIRDYYIAQLDNQRFKLLTSNSLVGNPAALFDAVGTGARDLLVEPGKAKGSGDFLASIERGSRSFFTHTVGGIADTVSKFPRAVSTGIERAVGDDDYLQERHRIRGSNLASGHRGSTSKNPAQGLATGAISLMHGISSGVTGFIREPVQGAKQGGAGGLLKGIGKAFIGGVAKPVAGAMDFVAEPVAGLSWQMSDGVGGTLISPERPPRAFRGSSSRVEQYDWRYSVGAWLLKAVLMASGASARGKLIDWVELSDRKGRNDENAELWVWFIVQKFSRSMPGMKRQLRSELKQHGKGQSSDERHESRPEKTRVALLSDAELIIATLDCKLVTIIPLWKDATYEVVGDGKEVILCARIVEQATGKAREPGSSSPYDAQPLIQAPWDASCGRRRKPAPGESCIDRIACGSTDAQDDLRKLLLRVTDDMRNERNSDGDTLAKKLMWSGEPSSSEQELSTTSQWRDENGMEMHGLNEGGLEWKMEGGGLKSIVGSGSDPTQCKADRLDLIVRRLSSKNLEEETIVSSPNDLRMVIANKSGDGFELRLKSGRLERGFWKIEAPVRLAEWEAVAVEVAAHDHNEGSPSAEDIFGQLEYSVVEVNSGATFVGDVVIDFSKRRDSNPTLTSRADEGLVTEVRPPSNGQFAGVVSISREGDNLKTRSIGGADSSGTKSGGGGRPTVDRSQSWADDPRISEQGLSEQEQSIQQLIDIGFKLEDAVEALANSNGDIVKAVDLLTRST